MLGGAREHGLHLEEEALPPEARKVRILNVGLLDLYQSRGAVGHALPDIRERVTKRLKGAGHE